MMKSVRLQLLVTLVAVGAFAVKGLPPRMSLDSAVRLDHLNQVRRNLKWNVEVNAWDCFDMTPLHWAAVANRRQMAELLISHGADVEAQTRSIWQSVQIALGEEGERLADLLIEDNQGGEGPLHCAAESGSMAVAELLITKGADVNAMDKAGRRPLTRAIEEGNRNLADLLRRHGARE